jgi:cytochrome b involved in lipid metabolism
MAGGSSEAKKDGGGADEKKWPEVTLEQLATHRTTKSCWIAFNGGVFDATPFLDEHPGGSDQIMNFAGKDATRDFDQ